MPDSSHKPSLVTSATNPLPLEPKPVVIEVDKSPTERYERLYKQVYKQPPVVMIGLERQRDGVSCPMLRLNDSFIHMSL